MNYLVVTGGSLIILSMLFYLYKLFFDKYSVLEITVETIFFIYIGFSILGIGKYYEHKKTKILMEKKYMDLDFVLDKKKYKRI